MKSERPAAGDVAREDALVVDDEQAPGAVRRWVPSKTDSALLPSSSGAGAGHGVARAVVGRPVGAVARCGVLSGSGPCLVVEDEVVSVTALLPPASLIDRGLLATRTDEQDVDVVGAAVGQAERS